MFAHHVDELLPVGHGRRQPGRHRSAGAARRSAGGARLVNGDKAEPSGEALHDGFFRRAERRPDAPAVFAGSGDLSYGQLRDQALTVAAALRANGIGAGDTVAVMGPKHAEQVPALLGILAAGAVYLPIAADQPRDRAERMLGVGGSGLIAGGDEQISLPVPALRIADVLDERGPHSRQRGTAIPRLAYVCSHRVRPGSRRVSR